MTPARPVGKYALLALGINGVVGVGIFFAPSELAVAAGRLGSVAVLVVVALALVPVAATFAILGRRFPEDGGPVTFAREAFGEHAAFLVGWLAYASALFSTAAVISGLTHATFTGAWVVPASMGLALGLSTISALGIDVSRQAWSAMTIAKLTPLVALAALAVAVAPRTFGPAASVGPTSVELGRAALGACFVLQGFEVIPVIGGQTSTPERDVPFAIFGTLGFAALLYAILQWAYVSTAGDLSSGAPLVAAATALGGARFGALVQWTTSLSALGIAFGMVVTTPRYLSALAPRSTLARTNARGVPTVALAVTVAGVTVLLALGKLGELFALASLAVVVQYGVVAAALYTLARRRALGLGSVHLLPAFGTLAVAAWLLTAPVQAEWLTFGAVAATGVVAQAVFFRRKQR